MQASKQASKKTDFTVDPIWWGLLRLAPIIAKHNFEHNRLDFGAVLKSIIGNNWTTLDHLTDLKIYTVHHCQLFSELTLEMTLYCLTFDFDCSCRP